MKRIILFIAILLLICIGFSLSKQTLGTLYLPSGDISLTVLDTPGAREQGLSGRTSLPDTTGMLFVFDAPARHAFWMKDMKFSIDIIWLDSFYKIVHIESNVSPETFPKSFEPPQNSLFVLEANAHFSSKNNLKVGDILKIDLKK